MVSTWESKRCNEETITSIEYAEYFRNPLLLYDHSSNFKNMTKLKLKNEAKLYCVNQINLDNLDNIDIIAADLAYISYSNGNNPDSKVFRRAESEKSDIAIQTALEKYHFSSDITVRNLLNLEPKIELPLINWQSSILEYDILLNKVAAQPTVHLQNVNYNLYATADEANPFFLEYFPNPLYQYTHKDGSIVGVQTPWYYYSFLASHTPAHIEDVSYGGVNVHLGGANQLWWGTDRDNTKKLWDRLKTHNNEKCVAHFRDKASLIKLSTLDEWGIDYKLTIQKQNEIIFSPSGCAHQVVSTGRAAKKAINYIDRPLLNEEVNIPLCPTKSHLHHGLKKDYLPHFRDLKTEWIKALPKYSCRIPPKSLPFDCDKCNLSFGGKRSFKTHMQMHHNNDYLSEINGDKAVSGFFSKKSKN